MNLKLSPFTAARRDRMQTRGAALVITLAFLVLLTVLVVGMAESLRVERSASRSHMERARATTFAQHGIDQVLSALRKETVDPSQGISETDTNYNRRTRHWVSQPGQLLVPDSKAQGQNTKRLARRVPLSSGAPSPGSLGLGSATPEYLLAPDLNSETLMDPSVNLITQDGVLGIPVPGGPPGEGSAVPIEMKLRWAYVRQDGTYDRLSDVEFDDVPDTKNTRNPIVGRFAYWTDDETAKINYNLAWTRDSALNKNPPGHQTKIDMRSLQMVTPEIANAIHGFVTPDNYSTIKRFFNSPFDARQIPDPSVIAALNHNKFNLTHFNHDPDTTYFGRQRMVLTTKADNAKGRPFLDILKTPTLDPGEVNNLDPGKLTKVMTSLVTDYLQRNDWPMVDGVGASLQSKYYAGKQERLAQLALNIVDYVRSAESEKVIVEPIRGKYVGSNFTGDWSDQSLRGQDDSYKGLTRSLMITEMGAWVDNVPVSPPPAWAPKVNNAPVPLYRTRLYIEVHLPADYGIPAVDLRDPLKDGSGKNLYMYFWPATRSSDSEPKHYEPAWNGRTSWASSGEEAFFRVYGPGDESRIPEGNVLEAISDPTKMIIKAGEYRTLFAEFYRTKSPIEVGTLTLRGAIATGKDILGGKPNGRLDGGFNARYDVAPLGDVGSASPLSYTLKKMGALTVSPNMINSVEVDDPRVNGVASDWFQVAQNTFGGQNTSTKIGKPAANVVPEKDTDVLGNISPASLRMPYRKGSPENPNGRVRSSGELGNIHTGIEGRSKGIAGGGVAWRTLRLQPNKQPRTVVPDWAFMDLFTVPSDVPANAVEFFTPHRTATGGRVNMNAHPEPFTIERIDPLAAVLVDCRKDISGVKVSASEARTLAKNIYQRIESPGSKGIPSGKQYGPTSADLENYESPGEVVEIAGIADRGESSEELVREIANLITARSNVFSVYTIGQALKQTRDGKLLVTGEQRQQAMIERYNDDKNTSNIKDDEVRFRTVYFRNLVP